MLLANKAIEGGKVVAEAAKEKAEEFKDAREEKARLAAADGAAALPLATPPVPPHVPPRVCRPKVPPEARQ